MKTIMQNTSASNNYLAQNSRFTKTLLICDVSVSRLVNIKHCQKLCALLLSPFPL